jgi:anti-sigma factor RsiW
VYVVGALSRDERRAFETHLCDCDDCRAELVWLAGLRALLARVPASDILGTVQPGGQ